MLRKFSDFLDNNQRQTKILQNHEAGLPIFSNLPLLPNEEDYFADTDLLRQLIEVKAAINIAIAELEHSNTLNEDNLKMLLKEKLAAWINKAFAHAVTDLFDNEGNILPAIANALPAHENTNHFKFLLLSSYIEDVVGGSESCRTSMQCLQLDTICSNQKDVLHNYFMLHLSDILHSLYQNTPVINVNYIHSIQKQAEFVPLPLNPLFTEDNDPMLTEQENIAGMLSTRINQLLLKDVDKSGEIVELVLQDKRIINYVLKKFKLFGIENIPDDCLGFLYGTTFSPHVHTKDNLTRAHGHVLEVFTDQLGLHGYTSNIVQSPHASCSQREVLILGAILWMLPQWYIIKFYNPEHAKTKDVFERLEKEKYFRTQPLLALADNYPLERFIPLLKEISAHYIPDHDELDAERSSREFTKQVIIESLLCPAKTNNLLTKYNYILNAKVLFPFELFQLQHHDKLTKKGDSIKLSSLNAPASILDASNIKTEKYLNPETEAYVAKLPIWQRLHVGAVIASLHITFTNERKIDENAFIAATREITVSQLADALAKRQQANDEYINGFIEIFSALETFDTGNVTHCANFKDKFTKQIKQELLENNWFSKGKNFIQSLTRNCATFIEILEASKCQNEQYQSISKAAEVVAVSEPVTPQPSRVQIWLPRIAIALGFTLGIAAIITAAVFTAGLILIPVAIALFSVGGAMIGGSMIGALVEYFKRGGAPEPVTPPIQVSYKSLAEAGLRPESGVHNDVPLTEAASTQPLNLPTHAATITPHPSTRP